jgi:RHS repeat-associated protein
VVVGKEYYSTVAGSYQMHVDVARGIDQESDANYKNDSISGANVLSLSAQGTHQATTIAGTIMSSGDAQVDEDTYSLGYIGAGNTVLLGVRLPDLSALRPIVEIYTTDGSLASIAPNPSSGVARFDVMTSGTYFARVLAFSGEGTNGQYLLDAAVWPTAELQFADLAITNVLAPATAQSGGTFRVEWTVGNFGTAIPNVSQWDDKVVLSVNDRFGDADDIQLGSLTHNGELQPGQTYTRQADIRLPELLSGTYHVLVKSDQRNVVFENLFETNNIVESATLLVVSQTPFADLHPTTIIGPVEGIVGEPLTVNWTVGNEGFGSTANGTQGGSVESWTDRLVLSHNTVFGDTDDQLLGEVQHHGVLEPGATYSGIFNAAVPAGLSGTYYVIVASDYANSVYEGTNTASNVLSSTATISIASAPYADLEVTKITAPFSVAIGQQFNLQWIVTNTDRAWGATQVSNWYDRVVVSSDDVVGNGDDIVLGSFAHQGLLEKGSSYLASATVTIPQGVLGPLKLFVMADSTNSVYEFNDESNNNSVFTPLSVEIVRGEEDSAVILTDEFFTSSFNNQGGQNLAAIKITTLPINGTLKLAGVAVIPDQQINLADLQADKLIYQGAPNYFGPDHFAWTGHDGVAFAPVSAYCNIILSNVNDAPTDIHLSNGIIAENSLLGTVIGTLTSVDDEPGIYNYQLLDDAGGRFAMVGNQILVAEGALFDFESSPANTIRVRSTDSGGLSFEKNIVITLTDSGPDLLITNLETPSGLVDVDAGSTIEVSWTLSTQGTEPSNSSWSDQIYLDNPDMPWLDRLVGSFTTKSQLPLSDGLERIQTIQIPLDMQGHFRVVVVADAGNSVNEGTAGETNNRMYGSVLFNVLNTNLHVESVTTPSSAFAGREIEVQWVVNNTGNATTSVRYWYDQIYLSSDTTLDGTDILLGTVQNQSYLDIEEGYTSKTKVTFPSGREGSYHILVKTDAYGYVPEGAGEGDNVTASSVLDIQPIPLSELSDPAVVSVVAPLQALSGQNMSLTYTIDNAGQAAIVGNSTVWVERIYMSTDDILDGGDRLLSTVSRDLPSDKLPEPDGQSHFVTTQKVMLPVGVYGDAFYFFVTVTPVLPVSNAFQSNDVAHDTTPTLVRLTPPPDLEASAISLPSSAMAGHDLTLTYQINNTGSTTTPNSGWYDSFYLSRDNAFDTSDTKLKEVWHSGALESSGNYSNTVTLRLPDGLEGSYYLITSVDSRNDVFELDNANNVVASAAAITITKRPADLVVTEVSAPSAAQAGNSMRVSWTVKNQGVGYSSIEQWTDQVILSRDAVLGNWDDVTIGSFTHSGLLQANQTYSNSVLVSLPGNLSGQYQLFVATDTSNQVYESNQNNNDAHSGIQIQAQPTADLQVSSVTAPATIASGELLTVGYTVVNAGLGRTNIEWWTDKVILSQDDTLGNSDDVNLGSLYHSNRLNPNESYQGTGSFKLPIDLQGGYHVFVQTDTWNGVTELNGENNNLGVAAGTTTVNLTATPDLLMNALQAADQGFSGQNLQLSWTVHNDGAETSSGWRQAFYLSRDGMLDRASDIYLGYAESRTALAGGTDAVFNQSFRIPDGISGKYYVFGIVDSNDAIYERGGEGNNTAMDATAVQITLQTPVDLVAGFITLPENGIPGAQASIAYTITNQSEQAVTGQWSDSIYLSSDAVWDVGDALFSRTGINGPLAGNASYTQTSTGAIPGLIGGDYYVIVRSDIFNQIPETNEANNLNASLDTTRMDVEALTLGTLDAASFAQGGSVYYRVDVAAGETLRFNFDRAATEGRTELFVSYDAMPSRSDFDYRYNQADSPDQSLVIANTRGGTYYVMAYNASGATDTYALTADTLQFSITEIGTKAGSNKGQVTVRIDGAELTTHTTAMLVGPDGAEHAASQVYWKDNTELWATFDLRGLATDTYDVKVQDGARTALLNDSFTVNNGELGHVEYSMETPSALRTGQVGTVRVYYQNLGDTDAVAPLLTVSGNALLKQPGDAAFGGTSLQLLGINSNGPAGILSPGAEGSFQLFFTPDFAGGGTVNLGVSSLKSDQVIDWNTILEASKPENISDESWASVKANLIAELGSTTADYQNNLAENATALDQLESRTDDVARLFSLDYMNASDSGALLRPTEPGVLGYSHTFVWDITATRQSDGNVVVDVAGAQEHFIHQSDGSYKQVGQGTSTLTETGGVFVFHQQNGTRIAFNQGGDFEEILDSNGHAVQAIYNSGHLTQIVSDNADSLSFTYNSVGRLIQQTDQAGHIVSYIYDPPNLHLTQVTTDAGTTEYSYVTEPGAALHQVSSITLVDGTVQHFEYDSSGQLIKESVNDGAEAVTYSYVGINEVVATDAVGGTTRMWLNESGQIAQVEDALGHVSQMRYDTNGNMIGMVNADGTSTSIQYDTSGNPLSVQNALGHTVAFSYDPQFGHLAQVTDQRGNAIGYGYDSQANLNTITYADSSSESFSYDAEGYLNMAVTKSGERITYTYDSDGHITEKSYADGTTATYAYDGHGNLISAVDSDSSTSFQYDAADRLIKTIDGDGRWLSYQYDAAGHRTVMADQAGNVTHYSYDNLGHLAQLTDGDGQLIASYSYDAAGHLSRGDNGNSTYTTYEYDAAGQLTHLVNHQSDSTVNSRFDYTYDAAGHRTSETTLDGTTSYEYNAIGHLIGTTMSDGHHIAYSYDAAGNRTAVVDDGVTTNYTTNNLNEYTGVGSAIYTYDADGNLTEKTEGGISTHYTYDVENHLVSVTTPTETWSYAYDALGNRIASVHDGVRTEYQLDPTGLVNVAGEYDGGGNLLTAYTYGFGLESQTLSGGSSYYYDYNAIGSTAGLSGSTGDYVNQYSYLPFGKNLTTTETVANSFEYVGQWCVTDEGNGLDFMRGRYYSESDGRFVQQDPSGGIAVKWGQVGSGALNVVGGGLSVYFLVGIGLSVGAAPVVLTVGTVIAGAAMLTAAYKATTGIYQVYSGLKGEKSQVEGGLFEDSFGLSENDTAKSFGKIADNVLDLISGRMLSPEKYGNLFVLGVSKASSYFDKTKWAVDVSDKLITNWDVWSKVFGHDIPIVRPSDPNDIVGPQSFGDEHWTSSQNALPYTIHYENQASATAPAQEVTITQTLDSDLNASSFRLGDFGWSDIYIDVPDGVSYYIDRINLTAKGYMVDVMAGIDVAKHEAYWSFTTIDPTTGEIPVDPTVGFLPTNVEKGTGEGFVNYTIRANADASTGTVIDAKATIVFTTQEPIDTPAIFNTLDTAAPESHIEAMTEATVESAQFFIRWSGSDVGSAIAGYSVYVSDNGGAYSPWLENTTLTEATYAGQQGHTYVFYTVATDNAGNKEAAPDQLDLTIHVTEAAALSDTVSPEIKAILLPTDGLYAAGQSLDFAVKFTETMFVDVAGLPPVIKLMVATAEVDAVYESGSGTDTLIFRHVVAGGEYDVDGIALGSAIVLNGATLRDTAGNPVVDLTFSAGATGGVLVDNPPMLQTTLADQTAIQEQFFSFHVSNDAFSDVDAGDSLSYTATLGNGDLLPDWLHFDAGTMTFSGTPSTGDVGKISVKVTASDSSSATASDTFDLIVAGEDLPVNDITGSVTFWKSGVAITDVTSTFASTPIIGIASDSMTTSTDGLYHHLDMPDGTYALSSVKVSGTSESNAVKANDALAALKIAVGMNPNADGSAVSSYQYLAADVNKDGQVKAADALNILKMAVKLSTAPEKEWLFVAESVGSETMSRTNVVWPDNPIPLTLNADQELDLIGIVKGDVNGSWLA